MCKAHIRYSVGYYCVFSVCNRKRPLKDSLMVAQRGHNNTKINMLVNNGHHTLIMMVSISIVHISAVLADEATSFTHRNDLK